VTPPSDLTATPRREFIRCAACALASVALAACGGGDGSATGPGTSTGGTGGTGGTGSSDPRFEINGSQIKVFLAKTPELDPVPSFLLINPASTVLLHTGPTDYAAFTSICTHEGCVVSTFDGEHMVCPCHGSTYDQSGNVVAGPATASLARFTTTFNPTTKEVVIQKAG